MAGWRWGLLVVVAGVVVMLAGFAYDVYYVNVPYQDAPPELAARHARHQLVAERIVLVGFTTTVVGALGAGCAWVLRQRRRYRPAPDRPDRPDRDASSP